MNINQLLNPELATSFGRPTAPVRCPTYQIKSENSFSIPRIISRPVGHSFGSHAGPDMRSLGSEVLAGKNYWENTRLTAVNGMNDTARQSYGAVSPYKSPDYNFPSKLLCSPPSLQTSSRSPHLSTRPDATSQLPIGNISLHNRGMSLPRLTEDHITGGELGGLRSATMNTLTSPLEYQATKSSDTMSEVGSSDSYQEPDRTDSEEIEDEKPTDSTDKRGEDIPKKCSCNFIQNCGLDSPDRKVVSHFFGRNKKCTRLIPEDCWATFCRRHYQRTRYRDTNDYGATQMGLVLETIGNLQQTATVAYFDIVLRKRTMDRIKREDEYEQEVEYAQANRRQPPAPLKEPTCPDRWLLPHLGRNKTFEETIAFVNLVLEHIQENNCKPPEFEILPTFKTSRVPAMDTRSVRETSRPTGVTKSSARRKSSGSQTNVRPKRTIQPQATPNTSPRVKLRSRAPTIDGPPTQRSERRSGARRSA